MYLLFKTVVTIIQLKCCLYQWVFVFSLYPNKQVFTWLVSLCQERLWSKLHRLFFFHRLQWKLEYMINIKCRSIIPPPPTHTHFSWHEMWHTCMWFGSVCRVTCPWICMSCRGVIWSLLVISPFLSFFVNFESIFSTSVWYNVEDAPCMPYCPALKYCVFQPAVGLLCEHS